LGGASAELAATERRTFELLTRPAGFAAIFGRAL